jgi:carboxyl-terminal processing protease
MQKMAKFIMSKKFIPVALVLVVLGVFLVSSSVGNHNNTNKYVVENSIFGDNPKAKYEKVLRRVGLILRDGHFSPRKIDDSFSLVVLNRFVEELDNEKNLFLQADIDSFNVFKNKIDDEINGEASLNSFYAMNEKYNKRFQEGKAIYTKLLEKPFDFSVNESIETNTEKLEFPKTEAERLERWRKQVKYAALIKYNDLLNERTANKGKKGFVIKKDTTLEREARDYVKKQMDRYLVAREKKETMDVNFAAFVNCVSTTMDPHTDYFPPIDLRTFNEGMSGKIIGIGALIKEEEGKIKIGTLSVGLPAWKSGEVKENDEILKIGQGNDEPVEVIGFAVSEVVKLIRGSKIGSVVKLTLKKPDGIIKVVSLTRAEIDLDDTYAKSAVIQQNGKKMGLIFLPEFYADFENPKGRRCAEDVEKEIVKLKEENVDGIILDLRNNGGGSLYDVVSMVGLFIDEGAVVQVKARDEAARQLNDRKKGVLYNGPLTVLINEFSASASEIFAAAIQDYKRGIVIGSTSSYGKGTVQRNIPLNVQGGGFGSDNGEELGALKLTLQKFYRVNGGSTQKRGVVSDIVLPDRYEYLKYKEGDNKYALPWDEIAQANIKPWANSAGLNEVIAKTNTEVLQNANFTKIKTNLKLIDSSSKMPTSLNLKSYQENLTKLKTIDKELSEALKLTTKLTVTNLAKDAAVLKGAPKDKEDKNSNFLKALSQDIYVNEAVKVLLKLTTSQAAVAVAK